MNAVIYDGDCPYCISKVQGFEHDDINHLMEFIPRQEPSAEERFPEVIGVPLDDGIIFVDEQRQLHVAADGIYQIARLLPSKKWELFAALYPVPVMKQVIQIGYRIIAANRKRLGKTCVGNVCKRADDKSSR